jgi:hypothetical protein
MISRLVLMAFLLAASTVWAKDYVVEASNAKGSDNIAYRVGLLNDENGMIDWGIETKIGEAGKSVRIVTEGRVVVLVYRKEDNGIFYQVGLVNTEALTIDWGPKQEFTKGKSPNISMHGKRIVAVIEGSGEPVLRVMHGWIEAERKQINWGGRFQYDEDGRNPTIAIGTP